MPIIPGVPAPNLAARMGADDLREQGGVTYRELRSRSLLSKVLSPRMPFTWSVNPYRGCAMGCRYCYATYTHEFLGITTPETLIDARVRALEKKHGFLGGERDDDFVEPAQIALF